MVEDPTVGSGDHDDVVERPAGPLKSVRVRLALLVVAIAIVGAGLVWYFDHLCVVRSFGTVGSVD